MTYGHKVYSFRLAGRDQGQIYTTLGFSFQLSYFVTDYDFTIFTLIGGL